MKRHQHHHDSERSEIERKELGVLKEIERDVDRIERELRVKSKRATSTHVVQLLEGTVANSITGIVVGTKGSFSALAVPAGSVFDAAPVWASSDPLAVVTAAADGLTADVAVDAAATGAGFTLSVSVAQADGTVASGSADIPYLPAPPPPPVKATSIDINQTA